METPSRRGTKLCISPIEIVTETDNFSLNFDNRLIFVPHIEMHKKYVSYGTYKFKICEQYRLGCR